MTNPSGGDPRGRASDRLPLLRLARSLVSDGVDLVRQEIRLARIEAAERLHQLARDATLSAVGMAIAAIGLLVLVEFLVIGLGLLLGDRYWLSSLIVALLLISGGCGVAWLGMKRFGEGIDSSGRDGGAEDAPDAPRAPARRPS